MTATTVTIHSDATSPDNFHVTKIYPNRADTWSVPIKYQQVQLLVQGSQEVSGMYGVICSANKQGRTVDFGQPPDYILKRLHSPFLNEDQAKLCLRELAILRHLNPPKNSESDAEAGCDNVMTIDSCFSPEDWLTSPDNMRSVYISSPYGGHGLNFYLQQWRFQKFANRGNPTKLGEDLCNRILYISYQILRGLKYIHTSNIVHRDIKPSNIVVTNDTHVKIIDFGMARDVNKIGPEDADRTKSDFTTYVQAQAYRAPELIFLQGRLKKYNTSVDIWSFGLVMLEMFTCAPLFNCQGMLEHVPKLLFLLGKLPYLDVLKEHVDNPGAADGGAEMDCSNSIPEKYQAHISPDYFRHDSDFDVFEALKSTSASQYLKSGWLCFPEKANMDEMSNLELAQNGESHMEEMFRATIFQDYTAATTDRLGGLEICQQAADLLSKCITWDLDRVSATSLIQHDLFKQNGLFVNSTTDSESMDEEEWQSFHYPDDEPTGEPYVRLGTKSKMPISTAKEHIAQLLSSYPDDVKPTYAKC